MMMILLLDIGCFTSHDHGVVVVSAYSINQPKKTSTTTTPTTMNDNTINNTRRNFMQQTTSTILSITTTAMTTVTTSQLLLPPPQPAYAVGPVKLKLQVDSYSAKICPKDRPIPGEKAMKGMKGLCVTVQATLLEATPKDLVQVGVYGFVIDSITGNSVLANNPDLSTDAGQFAMIENTLTPSTTKVEFEFIAAVPMDKDVSKYDNGIGELMFDGLRVISFPGGQQFGAVSPCEMNEFSTECEDWEEENGPYVRGDFMIKSNPRTKGR